LSIDSENEGAVKAVSQLLADIKPGSREMVLRALGDLGQRAHATIPVLLNTLNDQSPGFRGQAALALAKIGYRDKKLVAVLIKLLQSSDLAAIQYACQALQTIGPAAKMAIPDLRKGITDPRPNLPRNETPGFFWPSSEMAAMACLAALWRVEPENELPKKTLAAYLHDPRPEHRFAAAVAIASLGDSAKELTSMVAEALENESQPSVQASLRGALDALAGVDTKTPFPSLRPALGSGQ
jgi:HEAT repeat protein